MRRFKLLLAAGLLIFCTFLQETWRQHLLNPWLWLPAGLAALLGAGVMVAGLMQRRAFMPLLGVLMVVVSAFTTLAFTLFPWIVPPLITVSQAAAPPATQTFVLLSFALLVPVTLLYNTWAFRLFSGKIVG